MANLAINYGGGGGYGQSTASADDLLERIRRSLSTRDRSSFNTSRSSFERAVSTPTSSRTSTVSRDRSPSTTYRSSSPTARTSGRTRSSSGGSSTEEEAPKFLEDHQLSQIEAALNTINAQFGREKVGLKNDRNSIRRAFQLLSAQFDEEEDDQLELSEDHAAGAGRIRSGLFLEEQGDIADEFADRLVRARADRDSRLTPIQQALATLQARREERRAERARELARGFLDTKEALAQALELV